MDVARDAANQGAAHGTTFVARTQTLGRGRRGRSWLSLPDAGLWFTTLVRLADVEATRAPQLALVAGAAMLRSLHSFGASEAKLKWPNDILVGRRKLCGILVEAEALGSPKAYALIGVGLNLLSSAKLALPQELQSLHVGLDDIVPSQTPQERLSVILPELENAWLDWRENGLHNILELWQHHDALKGHQVSQGNVSGIAAGLSPAGALQIQTPQGIVEIASGEVWC